MHFEVNGQRYFLNFNPGEGRWILLTPTLRGIRRIDILDDNAPMIGAVLIPDEFSDEQQVN
ncbi:MAG TPA: hypothetical protein VEG32_04075 [Clostridia bacterium]|nr:hypothetical protein [Clostridia bacterium]